VLVDYPVQDRVGSGARDVGSHSAGPSAFRAVPAREALRKSRDVVEAVHIERRLGEAGDG